MSQFIKTPDASIAEYLYANYEWLFDGFCQLGLAKADLQRDEQNCDPRFSLNWWNVGNDFAFEIKLSELCAISTNYHVGSLTVVDSTH